MENNDACPPKGAACQISKVVPLPRAPYTPCGIAAAKGNQIIGLTRRNIVYTEKELIIPLHKTIVRRHLEYGMQAWRPYRKKDIKRGSEAAEQPQPKHKNI